MKITHIVFDLGGVILTNDWHYDCPAKCREFSNYFSISESDMERGWKAFWPQFSAGKITEEAFWEGFLKEANAKIVDIAMAKRLWRKYQHPIEDMLHLLGKLKKHYTLAAFTAISKEWLDYKTEKYKLGKYFDIILSSGYDSLAKVSPRAYYLLIQKLNTKPAQCLFVDDNKSALLVAKKRGLKTLLFKGQLDLEKKFRLLGIKQC